VLPAGPQLAYADDSYAAAQDADALLVLTDWAEFAALDLDRLKATMRYPIVIDGRNLFEPAVMADHGFTYLSIGRPAANPVREPSLVTS
jgi:UDPglucose 6-dehydrogenase